MRVFKKRNAVLGWLVARVVRKRLERRLNEIAGHPRRRRPWPALAAGLGAGLLAAGALVARRSRAGGPETA